MNESPSQSLGPCPELEALAALADGLLEGEEREQLLGHLAACTRCYEIFEDTMAVMEDLEEETAAPGQLEPEQQAESKESPAAAVEDAKILPFGSRSPSPSPSSSRPWLLAAGTALATAAALLLIFRPGPPEPAVLSIPAITSVLAAAGSPTDLLGEDWATPPWPALRGAEEHAEARVQAFRIGVEAVSLQLALGGAEKEQALHSAQRLDFMLRDTPFGTFLAESYDDLANRIEAKEDFATLSLEGVELAEKLPEVVDDSTSFEIGAWAMAGWLASEAGLAAHFTPDFRRASWPTNALDPSLADALGRLEGLLEDRAPQDLEVLAQGFEDFLVAGGSRH